MRDIVHFYRRVVDEILSRDYPRLERFLPEVEEFRHRWITERGKRDNRLISEAEMQFRQAVHSRA